MTVGKNLLQVSTSQHRIALANVYRWLVSIVLILVSVSVTQVSTEKVARATELSCAEGGVCEPGDIGPGGGIVFYVHASGTFSCGETLASQCNSLESATSADNSWSPTTTYVYSGNTTSIIQWPDRSNTSAALGSGSINTKAIVTQSSTAGRAGTVSRAYRGPNNFSDWYLPSSGELSQLYSARSYFTFSNGSYWASDGCCSSRVNGRNLISNSSTSSLYKNQSYYVQPIRAFASGTALRVTYAAGTGGSGSAPSSPTSVLYGSTFTTPSNTYSRSGYTFAGWNDGSTTYAAEATYPSSGTVAGPVTLTATWTATTLAAPAFTLSSSSETKAQNVAITGYTISSTGGTVASWSISPAAPVGLTFNTSTGLLSGTPTTVQTATIYTITATNATSTATQTFTLTVTAAALTVTYNSQSGSAVSAGSTTSGGEIASAPVAPTRTGYAFTGWFTASTGGSAITFPYTHSQTADFTLHAQWSQASLHGISSVSKIGTITTTANVGNTFAVDT